MADEYHPYPPLQLKALKGQTSLSSTAIFSPSHLPCTRQRDFHSWQQQGGSQQALLKSVLCVRAAAQRDGSGLPAGCSESWLPRGLLARQIQDCSHGSNTFTLGFCARWFCAHFFLAVGKYDLLITKLARNAGCVTLLAFSVQLAGESHQLGKKSSPEILWAWKGICKRLQNLGKGTLLSQKEQLLGLSPPSPQLNLSNQKIRCCQWRSFLFVPRLSIQNQIFKSTNNMKLPAPPRGTRESHWKISLSYTGALGIQVRRGRSSETSYSDTARQHRASKVAILFFFSLSLILNLFLKNLTVLCVSIPV